MTVVYGHYRLLAILSRNKIIPQAPILGILHHKLLLDSLHRVPVYISLLQRPMVQVSRHRLQRILLRLVDDLLGGVGRVQLAG